MNEELPLADPGRVEMAERLFGEYKTMSPEEWVARFGYTVGCSSFDQYRYADEKLHSWIHRVHEILRTPGEVRKLQEQYLTEEEIKHIKGNNPFDF